MEFVKNLVMCASAGTGKTFSLATRFIQLMLMKRRAAADSGVKPAGNLLGDMMALTFSRAAMAEIYNKLLERLLKAAANEDKCAEERNLLGDDSLTRDDFRELLREVIDGQYAGNISTLDGFILRLIRTFPKECGFMKPVEMLDGRNEKELILSVYDAMLNGDDAEVRELIAAACGGDNSRMFRNMLALWLESADGGEGWREFALQHPESRSWTVDSMAKSMGVRADADWKNWLYGGVREKESEVISRGLNSACESFGKSLREIGVKFANEYLKYSGDKSPLDGSTTVYELINALAVNPDADSFTHIKKNKNGPVEEILRLPSGLAAAVSHDVHRMLGVYFGMKLSVIHAKLQLAFKFEDIYSRQVRAEGRLTFADLPRVIAAGRRSGLDEHLTNLEYRIDSELNHWALDEFQDTSESQWACLENLLNEAWQNDEKSAVVVGDGKQAIYAWRGGSDKPFEAVLAAAEAGDAGGWKKANLVKSYRYGKNTCELVNRVFGGFSSNEKLFIKLLDICPKAQLDLAMEKWKSGWMEHQSGDQTENGSDFVQVINAPVSGDTGDTDDMERISPTDAALMGSAAEYLQPLWQAHEKVSSNETVAVLVRTNTQGIRMAKYLRKNGLPAVWEGESNVADVPLVFAVLQLLHLAGHPQDTFSGWTVELLHLADCLLPDCAGDCRIYPEQKLRKISEDLSVQLARRGLARTLRGIVEAVHKNGPGLDTLSVKRLDDLVRAAVEYESIAADAGIDGFRRYVENTTGREIVNSPAVIRILSIHRSKGLTFDHVVVPVREDGRAGNNICKGRSDKFCGDGWVFDGSSKNVMKLSAPLIGQAEAGNGKMLLESMHAWYVAFTRGRRSLAVILPLPEKESTGLFFRDIVRMNLGKNCGLPDNVVFRLGNEPEFLPPGNCQEEKKTKTEKWNFTASRSVWRRSTPSASASHTAPAGGGIMPVNIFDAAYGSAAEQGTDEHEALSRIEWIAPEAPADVRQRGILDSPWRSAFVKPSPSAEVWREQNYELASGGEWQTGQFDRVVFDGGKAVIYDFKTNRRRDGESIADFERRMAETYAGQMAAYRRALHCLTGIGDTDISSVLLLRSSGTAVEVKP